MTKKKRMPDQPGKMSDIMKEIMERLLRDPQAVPSSEAAHVALYFANVAWNERVGLGAERKPVATSGRPSKQRSRICGTN